MENKRTSWDKLIGKNRNQAVFHVLCFVVHCVLMIFLFFLCIVLCFDVSLCVLLCFDVSLCVLLCFMCLDDVVLLCVCVFCLEFFCVLHCLCLCVGLFCCVFSPSAVLLNSFLYYLSYFTDAVDMLTLLSPSNNLLDIPTFDQFFLFPYK